MTVGQLNWHRVIRGGAVATVKWWWVKHATLPATKSSRLHAHRHYSCPLALQACRWGSPHVCMKQTSWKAGWEGAILPGIHPIRPNCLSIITTYSVPGYSEPGDSQAHVHDGQLPANQKPHTQMMGNCQPMTRHTYIYKWWAIASQSQASHTHTDEKLPANHKTHTYIHNGQLPANHKPCIRIHADDGQLPVNDKAHTYIHDGQLPTNHKTHTHIYDRQLPANHMAHACACTHIHKMGNLEILIHLNMF